MDTSSWCATYLSKGTALPLPSPCIQTGSEAHQGSCPMGPRDSDPGCTMVHFHPSSAEVKNAWLYTSTPPVSLPGVMLNCTYTGYVFMTYLVKRTENFTSDSGQRAPQYWYNGSTSHKRLQKCHHEYTWYTGGWHTNKRSSEVNI
jgi:hypothetical protein